MLVLGLLILVSGVVEGKSCGNVFPACRQMAHGIDVTAFYPWASDIGQRDQVIDFTCNQPGVIDNWEVPDQFEPEVEAIAGSVTRAFAVSARSVDELRASVAASFSTSAFFGLASASAGFSASAGYIYDRSGSILALSSMISAWKPKFRANWSEEAPQLGADARSFVHKYLSGFLLFNETTAGAYNRFIEAYGTDRPGYYCAGGMMRFQAATAKAYIQVAGQAKVEANAKAGFFGFLKASGAFEGEVAKMDEDFLQASLLESFTEGGTGAPVNPDTYVIWSTSLEKYPHLVPCDGTQPAMLSLVPLTELFPEELQSAFASARENWLRQAFLKSEMLPQIKQWNQQLQATLNQSLTCPPPEPWCQAMTDDSFPFVAKCRDLGCPTCCTANNHDGYLATVTDLKSRTQAKVAEIEALISALTLTLSFKVIKLSDFLAYTAQYTQLSLLMLTKTTLSCTYHRDAGMCQWQSHYPCCTTADQTVASTTWFSNF